MTLQALQDSELLEQVVRGERTALAELYDRHAPRMKAIAQQLLRDAGRAEDLVHEVFIEAWRAAESYKPSRGTVRTWLFVRLRSRAIDRIRAQKRRSAVNIDETQESALKTEVIEELTADRETLRRALDLLSDPQRRVLEGAYFLGLSSSEIAARESIPTGTVKSRLAAALRRLREALRDDMWEAT